MLLLLVALYGAAVTIPDADRLRYPLACSYFTRDDMADAEHCAVERPDGFTIAARLLPNLYYEHGLAQLLIPGHQWVLRSRSGRTAEMVTFDNGPDPFEQGLARAKVGGHLVYVDRQLRVRIRTRYDFGRPFRHGRAEICVGCVEQRIDAGEHSIMVGGRWGVIDRHGREIVAPTLRPDELDRLAPGISGDR